MSRFAQQLRHAAFSEIVAVGGGIVVVWIEAIRFVANVTALTSLLYTMYVLALVIATFFGTYVSWAFLTLGKRFLKPALVWSSYATMLLFALYFLSSLSTLFQVLPGSQSLDALSVAVLGLVVTVGGFGVYSLRQRFGLVASVAGALFEIVGLAFIFGFTSGYVLAIGFSLYIPALIVEIAFLF